MVEPLAAVATAAPERGRWLLLFHQLPPKPDYVRVKVRRRLQKIGAVLLKNSVYVLPQTPETLEDFQWLRREISHEGGEATLCAVGFIEGTTDAEVEDMFRRASDDEYVAFAVAVQQLAPETGEANVERLRRQLAEVVGRDFFGASQRMRAERALAALAARPGPEAGERKAASADRAQQRPKGATWVTREDVYVDRIASAWLIRRFVDLQAQFKFVAPQGYQPDPGELRFDTFEGEFTHEGDRCTFETLLVRFGLDDPALRAIGEVVHDIDCKDERFGREEVAGVASVIRGIALSHSDDMDRIEAGAAVFNGLYAQFGAGGT